jgi:hypothetical protein
MRAYRNSEQEPILLISFLVHGQIWVEGLEEFPSLFKEILRKRERERKTVRRR